MASELSLDQLQVLCRWSAQALADELHISLEAAGDLLEAAYDQGRVEIKGNDLFAGVMVDGRWLVVEGRYQLQQATTEWLTLQFLDRQFED